jgi:3-oxoacyl-[acyl-carrier protein] reductase
MELVRNKVVLITGGSRGIGKGLAEVFAKEGAQIAFTFLSSVEKAKAFEDELSNLGVKVKGYQSDASNYTQAEQLIEQILVDFGGLDVVINNAGITKDALLMRMSEQQWDDVMNTNLKSVFNITKAAIKPMMKAKSGIFINMSSVVGVNGNAGQSNYSASKAGIIAFTKSMAKELGSRNIRFNAVSPGFIETEMTEVLTEEMKNEWIKTIPLKRAGQTDDVANLCLFLASDLSSYITGQNFHVDVGMLM